ncbi:MAG: transaldolase family protein [Candidatus Firestonebacteria bacterium]
MPAARKEGRNLIHAQKLEKTKIGGLMSAAQNYLEWLNKETKTKYWIDSAVLKDIKEGLKYNICGVTTNPVLVAQAASLHPAKWAGTVNGLKSEEKAVKLTESVVKEIADTIKSEYVKSGGERGYVCAQINPARCFDSRSMIEMAKRFSCFAKNIAVKIPGTRAGMEVIEECVAGGITVTSTLNFTVSQAVCVLESFKKGVKKAEANRKVPGKCFTAMMIGRLDDYINDIAKDSGMGEGDYLKQAGIACLKRAYEIYEKEKVKPVLMPAAMRGTHHVTEFAGANIILSVPPKIFIMLEENTPPCEERINNRPDPGAIDRLIRIPEFKKAYEIGGLKPEEFMAYGLTQRALAQFIHMGWNKLEAI